MSYYFWINILSISIPFIVSFDHRLKFYKQWKFLLPAMLGTMLIFIPWDVYKTAAGVWGFNERYLQGVNIFNLPVEEWLFFIAIPYACLFTYHSFEYLIKQDYLGRYAKGITIILIIILTVVALLNPERTYTFVTFLATALFLSLHLFVFKTNYLGRFYFTFAIILIPFFIVNGALTGSFTPEPVVWYDNTRNLGIRLGTIPIEDSVYGLLLLLMNTSIYKWLQGRTLILKNLPS
ncbi:MAG: lycopene cyclase domain-containing protein [Lentimicrobiaceae bacterium]|nr:lycopene cyclase domain-containing protein [Lentimicrobiaceae bacterium]MCB9022961.1 lycopene cyclase domain-containing protein [Lentimicrobiaceae bacterium]MCO5266130.1 lycopene cyclase domain-containing protein [Lentimicrobium sp.]HPG34054.1 lycopene cyclase domain-containing protein [Lentimicrobium sp.]